MVQKWNWCVELRGLYGTEAYSIDPNSWLIFKQKFEVISLNSECVMSYLPELLNGPVVFAFKIMATTKWNNFYRCIKLNVMGYKINFYHSIKFTWEFLTEWSLTKKKIKRPILSCLFFIILKSKNVKYIYPTIKTSKRLLNMFVKWFINRKKSYFLILAYQIRNFQISSNIIKKLQKIQEIICVE